jgi:GTPase SAR1 family protein
MSGKSNSKSNLVQEVYSWSSQLASESRSQGWIDEWYVWPEELNIVLRKLSVMSGGVIGLIGLQGVGKSSALYAIEHFLLNDECKKRREMKQYVITTSMEDYRTCRFKWRREPELMNKLESGTHELWTSFELAYKEALFGHIWQQSQREDRQYRLKEISIGDLPQTVRDLDVSWTEKKLGKSLVRQIRKGSWLSILENKDTILIDTPDYSKTDRRLMTKDLDEVYQLWTNLVNSNSKPNIVIAIQKEMFRDHYFLDKMEKIEIQSLPPEKMIKVYIKLFGSTYPFKKEALQTIARMSRGIFRRYLRYINLALDEWLTKPKRHVPITTETVKNAVTYKKMVEDMELELLQVFPKQKDYRIYTVRLFDYLESGPKKQSQLTEELNLPPYTITRLLNKLELHNYIKRQRKGTDKIISIK